MDDFYGSFLKFWQWLDKEETLVYQYSMAAQHGY